MLAVLWLPPTAAGESGAITTEAARFERCDDQVNFFSVPMERVQIRDGDAGNDRVPEAYTPKPDPPNNTILAISALRCESGKVNKAALGPVTMAFANIELLKAPEGSPDDPLIADVYQLFFSTNSKPLADWFRAGTGLDAYHVPDIVYRWVAPELLGEAPFDFEAPAPRRWAFTVTGRATAQREAFLLPEGFVWHEKKTDGRTWRTTFWSRAHENYVVRAEEMTVMPRPGSELHAIMLPGGWPADEPYGAQDPFAVSGFIPDFDLVKTRTIIGP